MVNKKTPPEARADTGYNHFGAYSCARLWPLLIGGPTTDTSVFSDTSMRMVEDLKAMSKGIDLLPAVLPSRTAEDQPLEIPDSTGGSGSPFIVIVYNDDYHTFDEVEVQLQKATACTAEKAEALAYEIDAKGRAVVFGGTSAQCEQVANVLRQIRLQVETDSN